MNRRKFIKSIAWLLVLPFLPTSSKPEPEMLLGYPIKKVGFDSWIKANPKLLKDNIENKNIIMNGSIGITQRQGGGWITHAYL